VPRRIRFLAELPRNAGGKVVKAQLDAGGAEPSTPVRQS